jgi:cofilin
MSLDTSRVKAKMMYSSSKNRFQRELDGIHYELQAMDASQVDIDVISNRAY